MRDYLAGMAIDDVVPEPDKIEAGDDVLVYTFVAGEPTDLVVTFDMTSNSVGCRGVEERAEEVEAPGRQVE
jgi:hypothetical protein